MQYRNYLIIFSFLLFIPQITLSEVYSAKQLVEIAVNNSSLVKTYNLEVQSKEKLAEQSGIWDNPSFELGTEIKEELGGTTRSTRYGFSQTFYKFGKFSVKKRIFQSEAQIAKLESAAANLKLRSLIWGLIFEFKAAKEKLSYAEERLGRFKTAEAFLKSRVFVAPQKKAEASIVSAKLIILQKEQLHIQTQKENLWNELNSYLHLREEPEIKVAWYKQAPQISFKELFAELAINNPDLKKQILRIAQAQDQFNLAKIDTWPGLTVSGIYSNSSGFNPEKLYGLGVSIPLPILNTNSSAKAALDFQAQAEAVRLDYINEKVMKDLKAAFLNYEISKKLVLNLPIKKINELEKAIREIDKYFKRGQVDLLTYLEADSQLFESLSAILESQVELVKSISELQLLTGRNEITREN